MTLDFLSPLHPRHFGVPAALWDVAQNYAEAYAAEQVAAETDRCWQAFAAMVQDEQDRWTWKPDIKDDVYGARSACAFILAAIRARAQEEKT